MKQTVLMHFLKKHYLVSFCVNQERMRAIGGLLHDMSPLLTMTILMSGWRSGGVHCRQTNGERKSGRCAAAVKEARERNQKLHGAKTCSVQTDGRKRRMRSRGLSGKHLTNTRRIHSKAKQWQQASPEFPQKPIMERPVTVRARSDWLRRCGRGSPPPQDWREGGLTENR